MPTIARHCINHQPAFCTSCHPTLRNRSIQLNQPSLHIILTSVCPALSTAGPDGMEVNEAPISRPTDTSAGHCKNGERLCGGETETILMMSAYPTSGDTNATQTTCDVKQGTKSVAPRAKCRRRAANVLERVRVQRMNTAMDDLRRCLPAHVTYSFSPRQKLSKIMTLRLATSYIAALGEMLTIGEDDHVCRLSHVKQSYRKALGLPSRKDVHACCRSPEHSTDTTRCCRCEHSQIMTYED